MTNAGRLLRNIALLLLLVCAVQGVAVAKEISPKVTVRVDGMGQDAVEMAVNLSPGEYMRVELTAASGTGYEWKLEEEPKFVRVDKTGPEPVNPEKNLSGGPYRTVYTLQAGEAPGTESIRFVLARPWEGNKAAAKSVSITMTVDQAIK